MFSLQNSEIEIVEEVGMIDQEDLVGGVATEGISNGIDGLG